MPADPEQSAKIAKVGRGPGPMLLSVAAELCLSRATQPQTITAANSRGGRLSGQTDQVGPDFLISWQAVRDGEAPAEPFDPPRFGESLALPHALEPEIHPKPGLLIIKALIRLPSAGVAGTVGHVC